MHLRYALEIPFAVVIQVIPYSRVGSAGTIVVVVMVVVVVVFALTRIIKSVVTGQASVFFIAFYFYPPADGKK